MLNPLLFQTEEDETKRRWILISFFFSSSKHKEQKMAENESRF